MYPEREYDPLEPTRSEEQEVASGQVDETPALVLFGVVVTIGVLVSLVAVLAAFVYSLA